MRLFKIFKTEEATVSLQEDRKNARILRENPNSEEAIEIRLKKWHQLSFLDRFIDKESIKKFKLLYESSPKTLVYAVDELSKRQKRDFLTYRLNPAFYNSQLS